MEDDGILQLLLKTWFVLQLSVIISQKGET